MYGLEVTNCEDNKVIGNNFGNNSYYGILITNSNYNTLERNNVADNGFGEAANYSIFIFEQYSGDIFGVKLLDSSNNRFVENNVICNNHWGIRVLGSQHDNVIYRNNFIDNKVQGTLQVSMLGASMGMIANHSIWDNGTSGNYWSDYLTRYQNASEIDNTGIGDTPFVINENNIDHYPLMNPVDIEVIPEFPSWTPILLAFSVLTVALTLYRLTTRKAETNRYRTGL
jgi:parallel beta-helix repeat protein